MIFSLAPATDFIHNHHAFCALQPYNALDADAHELGRIYDVMHIHAIGGDGKFNKFDFFQQMEGITSQTT